MLASGVMSRADTKRVSLSKRRSVLSTDISTLIKDAREPEYLLLDRTGFDVQRKQYYEQIGIVKALRIVEMMGRYKPKQWKMDKLVRYYSACYQARFHLEMMHKAAQEFTRLHKADKLNRAVTKQTPVNDKSFACNTNNAIIMRRPKESSRGSLNQHTNPQRRNGFDQFLNSFEMRMKKQLKSMETAWTEVFEEGNSKNLAKVLALVGLDEHHQENNFDVEKWLVYTQRHFESVKQNKKKCCFN